MKTLILAMLVFSGIASAAGLEPRHIKLIEKAITAECGIMYDVQLMYSEEIVLSNDNGNREIGFNSVFIAKQPYDQNMSDIYNITVVSRYADGYDHTAQDWGLYSVESVKCELE